MRVVLQRVSNAFVKVEDETVGAIGAGLLALVGVAASDDAPIAQRLARKTAGLRIFTDDAGRFEQSLLEVGGEALVVSQFTLLADVRRGRRPRFTDAAPVDVARPLVDAFAATLRDLGIRVAMGRFGAMMRVELVNQGPVTIVLDSKELDRPRRG